jgi:hypothetical protein
VNVFFVFFVQKNEARMSDIAQILSGVSGPNEKDVNVSASFKRRGSGLTIDPTVNDARSEKPKKKAKISRELQGLVGTGEAFTVAQEQVSNSNTPMVSSSLRFLDLICEKFPHFLMINSCILLAYNIIYSSFH